MDVEIIPARGCDQECCLAMLLPVRLPHCHKYSALGPPPVGAGHPPEVPLHTGVSHKAQVPAVKNNVQHRQLEITMATTHS